MMWGGYSWGWMAPFMGVSAVLWWVLVVVTVVALVRWVRAPQAPADRGRALGDPRAVLDLRFARGEIDADEYAERRRLLTGS
jgi:putative membrane protein